MKPAALAALALTALPASAALTVYTNAGTFLWDRQYSGESYEERSILDITAAPDAQPASPVAPGLWRYDWKMGSWHTLDVFARSGSGITVEVLTTGVGVPGCTDGELPPRPLSPGEAVGATDGVWADSFAEQREHYCAGTEYYSVAYPITFGVRLVIDGSTHYGWVALDPRGEPTRWAFQDLPGVPALVLSGCPADCTADGRLTVNDFVCFQGAWAKRAPYGDFSGDGKWNINDFIAFQADFRQGCP